VSDPPGAGLPLGLLDVSGGIGLAAADHRFLDRVLCKVHEKPTGLAHTPGQL
jgi:hypothetical protein